MMSDFSTADLTRFNKPMFDLPADGEEWCWDEAAAEERDDKRDNDPSLAAQQIGHPRRVGTKR